MNPYSFVPVSGDARTWHTDIVMAALDSALDAGIATHEIGKVIVAKGSERQLTIEVAVHEGAPREERMSTLWLGRRHRYHDDASRTASLVGQTRRDVERWSFNQRRTAALAGGTCDLPENRWAIHAPLIARRYMEWRGLGHSAFINNANDAETFDVHRSGDRITGFSCTIGSARIDATWKATEIELNVAIPHTLDNGIVGHPVSRSVGHPALDDPALRVAEIRRSPGRTRLLLERAWTTLGDAP